MLEAVGDVGYDRTSVRTVLDRTDLYRQAFYDHFSSKQDCYLQAYDAALARIEAGMVAAASQHRAWRDQLRAGLGALLDFVDSEPRAARALIVEVHPAGEEAVAKHTAALARTHIFLDRARSEPGATEAAPAITSEAIASGIHVVLHSRLAAGDRNGFHRLLPELMYIAVLPYFGGDAARTEMRA
ncbi:MAG TPA: TetR family transcriptional regulator, partial [Solirubrobacterales bacterium]|nr:TetR family transcriptional regulator [Solirubrobacterales bacterium]